MSAERGNVDNFLEVRTGRLGAFPSRLDVRTGHLGAIPRRLDVRTGHLGATPGRLDVRTGHLGTPPGHLDVSTDDPGLLSHWECAASLAFPVSRPRYKAELDNAEKAFGIRWGGNPLLPALSAWGYADLHLADFWDNATLPIKQPQSFQASLWKSPALSSWD